MFRRVFSSTTTAAAFVATAGSSICSGSVTMGQPQQMRFKTTASANKNSGTPNDTQQLNQQFQSLEDFDQMLTTAQSTKSSWYRDLDTAFTVGSGLAEETQKPVVSAEFASSHMKDVPCVSSEETPWLLSSSSSAEFRHLSAASSSEKFGLSSSAVKETIAAAAAAVAEKPVIDEQQTFFSTVEKRIIKEQQTFLVKKQKFTMKTNHFFRKASKAALNKANSNNRKSQQQ